MIKKDVGIIALLMTIQLDRLSAIVYFLTSIIIYNVILKIKHMG
tara:strand:- start:251 stop:382 length:132 start_codon:yes stop_codon:yes gene_type:complete